MLIFLKFQDRFARPDLGEKGCGIEPIIGELPHRSLLCSDERVRSHYSGSPAKMKQLLTFIAAPWSLAAIETSKIRPSRGFWRRSIFDFCNSIPLITDLRRQERHVRNVPQTSTLRRLEMKEAANCGGLTSYLPVFGSMPARLTIISLTQ